MNIEVKGNSGCDIQIKDENNVLYVYKTCDDKYIKRLLLQGEKQSNAITTDSISIPNVYVNEPGVIKMDYIYGKNFIDFIERSSFNEIEKFVTAITNYIDIEISKSELTEVPNKVFLDKLKTIKDNCENNQLVNNDVVKQILNCAEEIFKSNDTYKFPIGVCHGDLTFSNIMFAGSKYYLIDFLDSFIETPIQDIVKIRQDTQLSWSLLMYTKQYDDIRVNMTFKYIDDLIDKYFSKYSYYNDNYNILQLMNILRILPYTKNKDVAKYLVNTLNNIIKTIKK